MKKGDISNTPAFTMFVTLDDIIIHEEKKLFKTKLDINIRECSHFNEYFRRDFLVSFISFKYTERDRNRIEKVLDSNHVLYTEVQFFESFDDFREFLKMYKPNEYTFVGVNKEQVALLGSNGILFNKGNLWT